MTKISIAKKKVKIYEDYTIKINTEERNNGPVYKSVNYYRISDEGKFYELKIENN
ncbi:hypothetical protein AGMMS49965_08920 [Bacteroidia bacterium]|nr:hypothetical protein AGMMS49965_08920 [Bacteroidia bacterium]